LYSLISRIFNKALYVINFNIERSNSIYITAILFAVFYFSAGIYIGISKFSPDSWAYYELSKTVFEGDFYKFNTIRSYYSNAYSASFPFGYPVVIAIVHLFISKSPFVGVVVNILFSMATVFVIHEVCKYLNLPNLISIAISSALLFYPEYIDEVFSARAIPLAVLMFVLAYYYKLLNYSFIAGLCLGISALVRFDFLVYAIVFQIAASFIFKRNIHISIHSNLLVFLGFIVGILPWLIYGYTHFGVIWVSDNSWVSISALPAFARDYPAKPIISAFENPILWITRVMGNVVPLIKAMIISLRSVPLLIVSIFYVIVHRDNLNKKDKYKVIIFVLLAFITLFPYIFTGYFDGRYFTLIFLSFIIFFVYLAYGFGEKNIFHINYNGFIVISIVLSMVIGLFSLATSSSSGYKNSNRINREGIIIESLYSVHKLCGNNVFIFTNDLLMFCRRYGAVTGMRVASLPSNYDTMQKIEKDLYFKHMMPYILIDRSKLNKYTNR
jgi:hypothetical protein